MTPKEIPKDRVKIKIPAIECEIELKIPAGIQPGEIIKLKGQCLPRLYSRGRGDMIVKVQVAVPKNLSRAQKQIIEELAKT